MRLSLQVVDGKQCVPSVPTVQCIANAVSYNLRNLAEVPSKHSKQPVLQEEPAAGYCSRRMERIHSVCLEVAQEGVEV